MKIPKEPISIENLRSAVEAFYTPDVWHCVSINGLFENDMLEIQWVFAKIGARDEWKVLSATAPADAPLPSLADMIPVARMYEGELRDLLGALFENSTKGMFLEIDAPEAPLRMRR